MDRMHRGYLLLFYDCKYNFDCARGRHFKGFLGVWLVSCLNRGSKGMFIATAEKLELE